MSNPSVKRNGPPPPPVSRHGGVPVRDFHPFPFLTKFIIAPVIYIFNYIERP